MKDIKITINDQEITVREGTTILEAATREGIYIPTLCHHPYLEPMGSCRLCAVDVKGERGMPSACGTKVWEGMEVLTDSAQVSEFRRAIIQPILARHPTTCLMCSSSCRGYSDCELRTVMDHLDVKPDDYAFSHLGREIRDDDPFFSRDYNLCILCGRCVRICHEVRQNRSIYFVTTDDGLAVDTPMSKTLKDSGCKFCGACVDVCPTGALMDKGDMGIWGPASTVTSICPYCGVGCQLLLDVEGGRLTRSRPDPDGPANHGQACVKGRYGIREFVHSRERLTRPLIRKEGELVETSWEEALSHVALLLAKYKPGERAVFSSAKCTNEENYVIQKFARAVLGTNNVDHCARLCHAPTVSGLVRSFGSGAMTNSIDDIGRAGCIFTIGSNTTETHPVIGLQVKKAVKGGAKLIVANPKEIDLCRSADVWLRHRPGTDVALLSGMARVIMEEDLYDKDFVSGRCEAFDDVRGSIDTFTPDFVEEATGVPWDDIARAARIYAENSPASILFAMGITQHTHGTDNVLAVANLAMLTGNVGKEGAGVNPLRGQNNVQGACDMGALPNVYPGYQSVEDDAVREKFEAAWGVKLDPKKGLTATEVTRAALDGDVRALFIVGENPVLSEPDMNHVEEALGKLEFLVVSDIFLTETARHAHVVLPAASFAEKDGTFTNTERRVQMVRKAIEPVGDSRTDWSIVCDIAHKMGAAGFEYTDSASIMEEAAGLTPIYGGISHSRLGTIGLQWPCPTPDHPGTGFLHAEQFTRGLGCFVPLEYRPPAELPDEEYPMTLTTARSLYHFHTGTMTRKVGGLDEMRPEERVELNPADAERLGLASGDPVEVASRRGAVSGKAYVTDAVPEGVVSMSFHFAESPANALTNPALDPASKIPELKVCAVRVTPKGGG